MASGLVNRANRPNTWLHRPALQREETLANSEPSTHGTPRNNQSASRRSARRGQADASVKAASAGDARNMAYPRRSCRGARAGRGIGAGDRRDRDCHPGAGRTTWRLHGGYGYGAIRPVLGKRKHRVEDPGIAGHCVLLPLPSPSACPPSHRRPQDRLPTATNPSHGSLEQSDEGEQASGCGCDEGTRLELSCQCSPSVV